MKIRQHDSELKQQLWMSLKHMLRFQSGVERESGSQNRHNALRVFGISMRSFNFQADTSSSPRTWIQLSPVTHAQRTHEREVFCDFVAQTSVVCNFHSRMSSICIYVKKGADRVILSQKFKPWAFKTEVWKLVRFSKSLLVHVEGRRHHEGTRIRFATLSN